MATRAVRSVNRALITLRLSGTLQVNMQAEPQVTLTRMLPVWFIVRSSDIKRAPVCPWGLLTWTASSAGRLWVLCPVACVCVIVRLMSVRAVNLRVPVRQVLVLRMPLADLVPRSRVVTWLRRSTFEFLLLWVFLLN